MKPFDSDELNGVLGTEGKGETGFLPRRREEAGRIPNRSPLSSGRSGEGVSSIGGVFIAETSDERNLP